MGRFVFITAATAKDFTEGDGRGSRIHKGEVTPKGGDFSVPACGCAAILASTYISVTFGVTFYGFALPATAAAGLSLKGAKKLLCLRIWDANFSCATATDVSNSLRALKIKNALGVAFLSITLASYFLSGSAAAIRGVLRAAAAITEIARTATLP